MAAKLVAEEGIQKGLILSLDEGNEWIIGRDPDACQLLIEDPSTSRKHLLCRKTPEGIFLQNLSSTNPVSINEEEIHEPRLLHNGDVVKIGSGLYRFYSEEEAQLLDRGEISQVTTNNPVPNGNEDPVLPAGVVAAEVPKIEDSEKHEQSKEDESHHSNEDSSESHLAQIEEDPAKIEDSEKHEQPNEDESHHSNEDSSESYLPQIEEDPAKIDESLEKPPEMGQDEPIINEPMNTPLNEHGNQEQQNNDQKSESMKENIETSSDVATEEKTSDLEHEIKENDHESATDETENISIFEEPLEKSTFPEINFDLTETGRWLLKVVGGPNQGAEFIMQPSSTYVIGTDPNSCDIVFHDTSVSRQHAKVTINEDDTIVLEDLKSRNGTFVDGKPLTGKETIQTNALVMIGTSSFVIYDREGEMHTIISPLLPSIVKVLQEEPKQEPKPAAPPPVEEPPKPVEPVTPIILPPKKEVGHDALGAFILIAIITGLFVIIGIGTTTLFKSQPIIAQQVIHPEQDLSKALAAFPNVKYSFNRSTGRLLLVGHVLTASDKNQLLYNLQGFNYIRNIDDSGVILDEGVWREINQVLSQNPNWNGISIHSPSPGRFVISGYLKTRKQAEQLWDYLSTNFPYLDLLEKRVIVEEDVVSSIASQLQNHGFKDITAQMNEGEVVLSGTVPTGKMPDFEKALADIKNIPGVRNIKNYVTEQAPEQSMINISDRYQITGFSHQGTTNTSVVINGRILSRGDVLDGMTITSIKPNVVFLEKDGIRYRIDYSQ